MIKKSYLISVFGIFLILIVLSLTSASYYFINIQNFAFSPTTLTINQGDTVIWTNYDSIQHTVTSDDYGTLNSPAIDHGNVYSYTFNYYGTVNYHCSIHTNMHGQIIVNSNTNNNYNHNQAYSSNTYATTNNNYNTNNYYNNQDSWSTGYKSAYDYSSITTYSYANTYSNTNYNNQKLTKVYYYVYYHTPDDYALAYKYVPTNLIYNKNNYPALYEPQNNFQIYTYPEINNYPGYGQPRQYTPQNSQVQIPNNYLGMGYLQSTETDQDLNDIHSEHSFQGNQNMQFTNPTSNSQRIVMSY